MEAYLEVAVGVPLYQLFTYVVAPGEPVGPGCRVEVGFGPRKMVGMVVRGPLSKRPEGLEGVRLRPVERVLDAEPVLDATLLELVGWLAEYYTVPPGEAYLLPLPPGMGGGRSHKAAPLKMKTERTAAWLREPGEGERVGEVMDRALSWLKAHGEASAREVREATGADLQVLKRLAARELVRLGEREVARDPFAHLVVERDTPPPLTAEQRVAVDVIGGALGDYKGVLLHGVTGSGKTEVYLHLIAQTLERGEGALVLVPEIALTPQLVSRFRARFGDRVAVQHSGLDPDARHEQWLRIRSGELPIVIGARSAVFSPVRDLGLIVVDEEHEPSFKQESSPRYHARDLALVRGTLERAPVLLGSATPSLESWANVARGKLDKVVLGQRVQARPLPKVELADLREAAFVDEDQVFSAPLVEALRDNCARGDQSIVFLNRRGFASFVLCRACGHTLDCPSCSVTFTWHRRRQRLVCHYCDRTDRLPAACPACDDDALQEVGSGTERVVDTLSELLPGARIGRMDRDTTRGRKLERLLGAFRRREIDVLVGTQMVAKGHDFPGVTLVGVLLAEQTLKMPDFRAAERTFQLMTQIAGRAGRHDKPGRVLIQTWTPDHYALTHARSHDSVAFLDEELRRRREQGYPPWSWLALVTITGPERSRTERAAHRIAAVFQETWLTLSDARRHLAATGPAAAPIERISERWRFQLLLRSSERTALRRWLYASRAPLAELKLASKVQWALDVDPQSFL